MIGTNADETSGMVTPVTTEAEYKAAVRGLYGLTLGNQLLTQYPAADYATPRKALIRLTTDVIWTCPARQLARLAREHQDEPVYRYHFTWQTPGAVGAIYGATHGLELPFVFGNFGAIGGYVPSTSDLALSATVQGYWSRFGVSGNPNGAAEVTWPFYDVATDAYLEVNSTVSAKTGLSTANCDFIDALQP
jgi:para-nitrobenzyl esterase